MDESKPSLPPNELNLQPASDGKPAVVDHDLPNRPSVVVYCGNEEEIGRGFLIALRAMGVAVAEPPSEPADPAVARAKP